MPSFAKVSTAPENPLANLWKDHPNPAPAKDLLDDSRTRAAEILSTAFPAKIAHIRSLIASEEDPSSLLWKGHVATGDYVTPRILQPDELNALIAAKSNFGSKLELSDLRVGEKIVLPSDVTRDASSGVTTPSSEMSEDTLIGESRKFGTPVEKGVPVGPHWFEVVPRNKVQTDLIEVMTKECEDLNEFCVNLRMWLELEIPLIEDGNSFGAEVQSHLIREIEMAQKRATSFHNASRQHHTDRIKLAVDWTRYPNVLDYPAAISHSDRFDHFLARSYLRQLLITYGGLMTKFQRNWEKVINPKGEAGRSSAGMY